MYPTRLSEFIKTADSKKLGLFTKVLMNREKFKKSIPIVGQDNIAEFLSIAWGHDIPIGQKVQWIKHNIFSVPNCAVCDTPLKWIPSLSKFNDKYCGSKCYGADTSRPANDAKQVIVGETVYSSINDAMVALNMSRFLLINKMYSNDSKYQFYPDHDKQMVVEKESLRRVNEKLLDIDFLTGKKESRQTMNSICEELNIDLAHLRMAYALHNIDTSFEQVSPETKITLTSKERMQELVDTHKNTTIISSILQCSPSAVQQYIKKHEIVLPIGVRRSLGEYELEEYIKSLGFSTSHEQYYLGRSRGYKTNDRLDIDVFVAEKNIGFEYNGIYWHSEKWMDNNKHNEKRTLATEDGVKLIQIFEDDWLNKTNLIKRKIRSVLGVSDDDRISASRCSISKLDTSDVRLFLETNHIQGHKNCEFYCGLIHNNILLCVLAMNGNKIERFAGSAQVHGAFEKCMNFAINELQLTEIVTFVDLCWSDPTNNIYTKNGFVFQHLTRPNYWYVVNGRRESRIKYQKHMLTEMASYSPEKSESEIMKASGYYRVFDAGHAKLCKAISSSTIAMNSSLEI